MLIDFGVLFSSVDAHTHAHVHAHTHTDLLYKVVHEITETPPSKQGFSLLARLTLFFARGTTVVSAHSFSEDYFILFNCSLYPICFPH